MKLKNKMAIKFTDEELNEILSLIPEVEKKEIIQPTPLKISQEPKKSTPVTHKNIPAGTESFKPPIGSPRTFPCKIPKGIPNTHCIYRLNFDEKYLFIKCKFFHQSILLNMKEIDRRMRLGCTPENILYKVIPFIIKNKVNICSVDILFQPDDVAELLPFEKKILEQAKTDPNCLNITFEPYEPKWISDLLSGVTTSKLAKPVLSKPTAEIIITHSAEAYDKNKTDKKKKTLKKVKNIVEVPKDRLRYSPEFMKDLYLEIERQMAPQNDLFLPQFSYKNSIMDFLLVKNNIVTEIEVKSAVADYWNDFQKLVMGGKHLANKHKLLTSGSFVSNYFYFLAPPGVILPDEIPDHCGFIIAEYTGDKFTFKVVKTAPKLHDGYVGESFYRTIAKTLSGALKSAKQTIRNLSSMIDAQEEEKLYKN